MKFELKHIMKVDDEQLLEDVNLYLENQAEEDDEEFEYKSLDDVPMNLLLEVMDYYSYFDTELENILIEELDITKL